MVKALIISGVDVNTANNEGVTPLHYAAQNGLYQKFKTSKASV